VREQEGEGSGQWGVGSGQPIIAGTGCFRLMITVKRKINYQQREAAQRTTRNAQRFKR